MCGRYGNTRSKQAIAETFHVKRVFEGPLAPNYNLAPTDFAPIIRNDRDGNRVMDLMRFGMVPSYAESLAAIKRYSLFNAMSEEILQKPSYRKPFRSQRGIAPVEFFYEWLKREVARTGKRGQPLKPITERIPFLIRPRDHGLFGFACVWDRWLDPASGSGEGAKWLYSFSIITMEPNEAMAKLHDRMPVPILESDRDMWLDRTFGGQPNEQQQLLAMIQRPFPSELMEILPANPAVNKSGTQGPELLICPTPAETAALLHSRKSERPEMLFPVSIEDDPGEPSGPDSA